MISSCTQIKENECMSCNTKELQGQARPGPASAYSMHTRSCLIAGIKMLIKDDSNPVQVQTGETNGKGKRRRVRPHPMVGEGWRRFTSRLSCDPRQDPRQDGGANHARTGATATRTGPRQRTQHTLPFLFTCARTKNIRASEGPGLDTLEGRSLK